MKLNEMRSGYQIIEFNAIKVNVLILILHASSGAQHAANGVLHAALVKNVPANRQGRGAV
jgi:hypothetical protein